MKHTINFLHAEKTCGQVKQELFYGISKNKLNLKEENLHLTGCVAQIISESGDVGAWAFNVLTKEFYFTEKWATTLGYRIKDYKTLTMKKVLEIIHPDDRIIVDEFLKKEIINKNTQFNYFLRLKSKSGNWVGVLVRGKTMLYNEEGVPTWMFGVHLDLTEFIQNQINRQDLMKKINKLHQNIPGFLYQFKMNKDGSHYFSFLTEGIIDIYGHTAEEGMQNPSMLWNIIHPDDILRVQKTTIDSANNMSLWTQRFRIIHPTKGIRWVEGRSTPQAEPDGSIVWTGYIHDDTDFQKSKDLAKIATSVYKNSQEGIIVANKCGRIEKVNPAFTKITGIKEEDLLNQKFNKFFDQFVSEGFCKSISKTLIENRSWKGEVLFKKSNKEVFDILLSIDLINDEDFNQVGNYVAIFTDIGQIKKHEEDLERLANYDCLTGLPNRRLLLDKLDLAINHSKNTNNKLAVCFIDLDKFKPINDKYGHATGDEFLCKLSTSLLNSVRSHDTVARLGGDEFVVIISDVNEDVEMENMLERLANACSQTYLINGINLEASASIGVVVYPNVTGSADELLRFADQSMYRAKQQGRKRYVYFDPQQEEASVAHYIKIEKIKKALKNGEISLWYQPKLEMSTNKIIGAEALVRWSLLDGTIIPAKDFINIIVGDSMDTVLGKFVLDRALKEQREWKNKNIDISVSINISPDHLLSPTFKEELHYLINKYQSNPKNIVIEILETSKISDFDLVIHRLQECISLGVSFSLDDFGTGYSSLGYLRSLPVQEVKIDKSFVQRILDKKEDKMIVQGIIDLSHGLDRKVLAEGVESKQHIEILNEMGIDMIQGYEISPPMPSSLFVEWMQKRENI